MPGSMDRKSQLALHPPCFGQLEAVPSVVPAKWWRRRSVSAVAAAAFAFCAVGSSALEHPAGARAAASERRAAPSARTASASAHTALARTPPPPAQTGPTQTGPSQTGPSQIGGLSREAAAGPPAIAIAVSNIYDITVPAGTWVPLAISITNRRASDLEGLLVLSVPTSPFAYVQNCYSNGASFVCSTSGFGQPSSYSSDVQLPAVTYDIPLSLAAGTEKELITYVLAESTYGNLVVKLRGSSGGLLATTSTKLPVAYGTPQPAVLVVTNNPSGLSVMANLLTPTGSHPQIQYVLPDDLPGSAPLWGPSVR